MTPIVVDATAVLFIIIIIIKNCKLYETPLVLVDIGCNSNI